MGVIKLRIRGVLWVLSALLVIAGALVFTVASDIYGSLHSEDNHRSQVISKKLVVDTYNSSFLSHRLIHWDENNGVASHALALRAYGNVSRYLSEVKSQCHSGETNAIFFGCANAILGKNFYYKGSNPVTSAWAAGYSDCDLNVYLLLDAATLAGKTAYIVYSPGHAFLAYFSEKTGELNYQETTAEHNNGLMADLADPFYRKTPQRFYYSPLSAQVAEQLYPALIIDETGKENALNVLVPLLQAFPDNPILTDQLFSYQHEISAGDIEKIEDLLRTDISSVTKKVIVARYFADRGDRHEALNYLNRIDDSHCGSECLSLKGNFSWYYQAMLMVIDTAKMHGVSIPFPVLAGAIARLINDLSSLMFLVVPSLIAIWLLLPTGKTIPKSDSSAHHPDMFSDNPSSEVDRQDRRPLSGSGQ